MATLLDLENMAYSWLREPEYIDPGGGRAVPPLGAQFDLASLDRDLNNAVQIFLARTGYAPDLADKMATIPLPLVPQRDYVLPIDLVSLRRIEYTIVGLQPIQRRLVVERFAVDLALLCG